MAVSSVAKQFAIAGCCKNVNTPVYSDDPTGRGQRLGFTLALEDRPPATVPFHHEGSAESRDRATLSQGDRPDAGDPHALLGPVEFERAVAVRKLQLLPARGRLKARITGRLAALDAPEKRANARSSRWSTASTHSRYTLANRASSARSAVISAYCIFAVTLMPRAFQA
jgi:hypothetical protein